MKKSLTPYEGKDSYIFVSYSHRDSEKVFAILTKLQNEGLRIWYDKGIEWGSEWPEYIAEHIINCSCFIAFHSQNSKKSQNCKHEIYFALKHEKEVLSIYLEEVKLNPGIEMQLSPFQATYFYKYSENNIDDFYLQLLKSQILRSCYEKLNPQKITGENAQTEFIEEPDEIYQEKTVPIIFILDTSGSMFGAPIENLNQALQRSFDILCGDSMASKLKNLREIDCKEFVTYKISIIKFDSTAELLTKYVDVETIRELPKLKANSVPIVTGTLALAAPFSLNFFTKHILKNFIDTEKVYNFPKLEAGGMTSLGAALETAKNLIEDSTVTLENWQNPSVILATDGYPTDDYQKILKTFITNGRSAKCQRYSIGIGEDFYEEILETFSNNFFTVKKVSKMENIFQLIINDIISRVV